MRGSAIVGNSKLLWALGLSLALVAVVFISCLLTAAEANIGPSVLEATRKVKAPSGVMPNEPGVWANAAILIDADSGRVLYEKNAHVKLPIASTTKMMTALVVRDQLRLNDKVIVSPEAAQVGEQGINLTPGETLTVEQLLNAMLIQSANDAACALAQQTTGSIESFAALMNKKAAEIGATDTHFANPHGLDQAGHYSSAYDLAVIGRKLMRDPVLARIVSTSEYSIPWPGHPGPRVALNHNEILQKYAGSTGIKTGYTVMAGQCLVASATRDDKSLIAVALNSQHRVDDVSALFDYGFSSTMRIVFVAKGERLGRSRVSAFPRRYVTVVPGAEMTALALKGARDVFDVKITIASVTRSRVKRGEVLGTIDVLLNGASFKSEKAVASQSRSASNVFGMTAAFFWYSTCWSGKIIFAPFRMF